MITALRLNAALHRMAADSLQHSQRQTFSFIISVAQLLLPNSQFDRLQCPARVYTGRHANGHLLTETSINRILTQHSQAAEN
jgi:hypothetical protein